jgi:hypothetical protein
LRCAASSFLNGKEFVARHGGCWLLDFRANRREGTMRKLLAVIAVAALFASTAARAVFFDFETLPPGLTPTANPTQGGLLDNASELNDELAPLRITSGALSSNAADSFPSISGLLDLTGTTFGPAHSGSNVVAGLQGGSGGPGSQAVIDFTQFVEIRVLQPGFTSVSEWIQLFGPGTSALVTVCSDLNCGTQLTQTTVTASGFFNFQAPAGTEIRNVGVIPVVPAGAQGGAWIDDVTVEQERTVPEPGSALLVLAALAALGARRLTTPCDS